MMTLNLQDVAGTVVRRAERQGFVVPRDVREEVARAGLPDTAWKEVLALARPALNYRHGRYYHVHTVSERVRQERDQQQLILGAIRQLIQQHRHTVSRVERREQDRLDFVQPVEVQTEDGRHFRLLSRDLSAAGIRLVSTRSFLGQKLLLTIPRSGPRGPWRFRLRVLWTCAVGDDLYENGGTFLEALPPEGEEEPAAEVGAAEAQ